MRWPFGRRWLFVPPIILGAVVLGTMIRRRAEPTPSPVAPAVRALRVIEVPQVALTPRVVGYGTAQAADIWAAVAEVKGRVISVHPELKAGAILHAGDEVLRIDPTDYELQIAGLEAKVAEIESQQAQLTAQEENYRASLAIEQKSLALAKADLARLQTLRVSNSVTETEVERKEREVLAQRQSVQSLNNSLNTLPTQQQALIASLAATQAGLQRAQLDLDHTVITAPLDCRLGTTSIEKGQFLAAGERLFEAHGTDVTEIEAQFPINQARTLLLSNDAPVDITGDPMKTMRDIFNVEVTVRLKAGDFQVEWPGRFDRVREQLDLETRAVRIVVAVDKPYENVIPGRRPPLAPGMFCEVELRGQPRTGQLVVPRVALRGSHLFVVNAENRLERRDVQIAFTQGGFACIAEGLTPGERIVVSDPTPAIEGMLVDAIADEAATAELVSEATGEGALR